jgi:circadian clock protein KaiC
MSGGPRVGGITIVAGAMGTGKTLAGLSFLLEGVRRGEKGLLAGFRETHQQLIDKASFFGLDLAGAIREGQIAVWSQLPVDLDLDQTSWELFQRIRALSARRVVVDSIGEMEDALPASRRDRGFMAALAGHLHEAEVTAWITREVSGGVAPTWTSRVPAWRYWRKTRIRRANG